MKPIQINNNERLTSDSRNFIYQRMVKNKDGENVWSSKAYYVTLSDAYISLVRSFIKKSDLDLLSSIKEAVTSLSKLREEIDKITTIKI